MARNLFDCDSSDEDLKLTLNEDYANRYETWRRKEELQKLKDKYGEEVLSESSDCCSDSGEDSEDESDDEPKLGDVFDEQFFKAFAAVKRRDASIYDKDKRFFCEKVESTASSFKEKPAEKPSMSLKEYHINLIEKKKGITEEDEEPKQTERTTGYYEELDDIKNEFKAALNDDQEDDDVLLKTVPNSLVENGEPKKNVFEDLDEQDKDLSFIKKHWSEKNDKLEENEKFLRDYILNQRYLESEPETHIQRVMNRKNIKQMESSEESEHEENEEVVKEEGLKISKYHFEEPDANTIKRYPRLADSVRDATAKDLRASKRSERKERKKKEKEAELQRLRELKRMEIKEKLQKLAEISGNKSLLNSNLDVDLLVDDDADFDPSKYDDNMSRLFDEQYYSVKGEQKKPEFDFVEGIDDVNDTEEALEDAPSTSKKMKRKKKHEKDPASKQNVGIFEDLIGNDLATRFKYRKVPENDFGLTNEELLFADDKELNKWVSLKKISQYRTDEEELFDQKSYATKKSMMNLKKKIFKSIYGESNNKLDENEDNGNESETNKEVVGDDADAVQLQASPSEKSESQKKSKKKRNKKKKASENKADTEAASNSEASKETNNTNSANKRSKRKRKRNNNKSQCDVSMDRLKSYGLTNRELKKRKLK